VWKQKYFESGADTTPDISLDEDVRLALFRHTAGDRPDKERRVRPGRLREIFDDARNIVVAFDQKHVARLERRSQSVWIARRERLVAVHGLLQIASDQPANAIEHSAHAGLPKMRTISARLLLSV